MTSFGYHNNNAATIRISSRKRETAPVPRGMDAELLRTEALEFGLCGATYPSVSEAYASALKQASDEDAVFVGGSTFTVAEVV